MLLRLSSVIPYGPGSSLLSFLFRSKVFRKLFCRPRAEWVRGFLDAVESKVDTEAAISQSLVSCKAVAWRLTAISRADDESKKKWVHVDGSQHLENAYREKKRLIVIGSHQGMARFVPQLMSHMGYPIHALAVGNFYNGLDLPEWKRISILQLGESSFFAKDVFVALKAIKSGKVFHMMADGVQGKAALEFPLVDRRRGFTKSYAELALLSGAEVIPVFTRIELSGLIKVIFCQPLDNGTEEMTTEDRVSLMVRQYVSLLSDEYRQDPASVHLSHIRKFLNYPRAEKDGD